VFELAVVQEQIQTVEEIYRLVWNAVASKRPIAASYHQRPRLFCPHRLGRNKEGELRVLCYQYGGESESGLEPMGSPANRRCVVLEKLSAVKLLNDGWRTGQTIHGPRPALSKRISTQKIISSAIHNKDTEEVARAVGGPGSFSGWQSNSDYVARGERGDPRGRKLSAGPGAVNPR
jgi:hypothetical protein